MPDFEIAEPAPSSFLFYVHDGEHLLTVHPDGRIERGPAFTTEEEASLKFWEILTTSYPKFLDLAIEHRLAT